MGKIASHPLRFLVSSVLVMVFMLFFVSCKSVLVFSSPPASGDWIVTGTESYYDEVIVLSGNLIVRSSGNLTFRKITLKVNCTYNGQYNITVESGGKFYVLEGSVITSANPDKRIGFFRVEPDSTFRMTNSELHDCGQKLKLSGLMIHSGDAIVDNSLFSRNNVGIIIFEDVVVVRNNMTENNAGIEVAAGANPIIRDNYISLNSWGMATFGSPTIYNNTITRNGRGIDVEGGSPTICNNTITENGVGIGLNGANPIIQDNTITFNNETGIMGTFCNPIIQGNNVTSNNGYGTVLEGDVQGIIQGNVIVNNSRDGIHSGDNVNLTIQGNIITSNRENGILLGNDFQAEVQWNDIYGNHDHNIRNEDVAVTVNATYNFWGYGHDPEKISSHVLYEPWLTESIFHAEITSPLSGETVSSSVTVSTEVDARSGVHKVEFYIDDLLGYTDYDASYEWNVDTTECTETEHVITAKAYDMLGLKTSTSITIFVDNTAPTISIKEPTSENIYSGIVSISVNVTDNRELANVHVKTDNTEWVVMTYNSTDLLWKYDLNTTSFSDGQHILMVLALDEASNPTTTSTTLFIDNTPPTLTIQTPQSGTTVGMTLSVEVQASDASGISRIEIYLQDVLVYTDHDAPYEWLWDTTQYPNGGYTITIKAYDTLGKVQTSETTVTVRNVESPWWQTNFWTMIEVLVAIGGLVLGIIVYLTRKREGKKKSK